MTNITKGLGKGFVSISGKIYLLRCFECGKENYAACVSSGICAWCGYNANEEEKPNVLEKD